MASQLVFVLTLAMLLQRAEFEAARARHSQVVISAANKVGTACFETGKVLFAYALTGGGPLFERRYRALAEEIPRDIAVLQGLAQSEPDLREDLRRVMILGNQTVELMTACKTLIDETQGSSLQFKLGIEAVDEELSPLKRKLEPILAHLMVAVSRTVDKYRKEESDSQVAEQHTRNLVQVLLAAGVMFNILLVPAMALYFNKVTSGRLGVLTDNARRLSRRLDLNEPLIGKDEISYVDQVFHSMAKELLAVEQQKQDFVNMISHDLKTPLTSVQLFLTAVADGMYEDRLHVLTERALEAEADIDRLIKLINQLLDIEKMESGMMKFQFQRLSLDTVVKRSLNSVSELATKQEIQILSAESGLEIFADEFSVMQVLVNLLSNAIKFSAAGGKVAVECRECSGWTEVRVIDNGRGVPADLQKDIFERFKQVSTEDGRSGKGTGLGLPICKAIIEGHKGEIGVDSDGESGSTFWFRLPAAARAGKNDSIELCQTEVERPIV